MLLQLYDLASTETLLDRIMGDKGERSQRVRLGNALGKMTERVIAGFRIEKVAEDRSGRQLFQLEPCP